jgi:hypothetical protein
MKKLTKPFGARFGAHHQPIAATNVNFAQQNASFLEGRRRDLPSKVKQMLAKEVGCVREREGLLRAVWTTFHVMRC